MIFFSYAAVFLMLFLRMSMLATFPRPVGNKLNQNEKNVPVDISKAIKFVLNRFLLLFQLGWEIKITLFYDFFIFLIFIDKFLNFIVDLRSPNHLSFSKITDFSSSVAKPKLNEGRGVSGKVGELKTKPDSQMAGDITRNCNAFDVRFEIRKALVVRWNFGWKVFCSFFRFYLSFPALF